MRSVCCDGDPKPQSKPLAGLPDEGNKYTGFRTGWMAYEGAGVIMIMEANMKIKIQVKLRPRVLLLLICDQDESQVRYGASWRFFFFLGHPESQGSDVRRC